MMLTSVANTGLLMADANTLLAHNHKVAPQINDVSWEISLHYHMLVTLTAMVYSSHLPFVKVELTLRTVCRQRAV